MSTQTRLKDLKSDGLKRLVKLYNLESYLFEVVSSRFRETQTLSPHDFFAIVIWKSNRAKTKVKKGLESSGETPASLMRKVAEAETPLARLTTLTKVLGIGLPIASAILSVCYPRDFTVLDYRVWGVLQRCSVDGLPNGYPYSPKSYLRYCQVCQNLATRLGLSLRDLDRALWAKSWEDDLLSLIRS